MDMDTPADYRALRRFAEALDGAPRALPAAPHGGPGHTRRRPVAPEPSLTAEEALYLLAASGTPANVVRHCRAVAAVGEALAQALRPHVSPLDVALVRAGCLLHDIARVLAPPCVAWPGKCSPTSACPGWGPWSVSTWSSTQPSRLRQV